MPSSLFQDACDLHGAGRLEEAVSVYEKSISVALVNRGVALRSLLRQEDALASYDQAIIWNETSAVAHFNRANTLTTLLRIDEAIASYDQAIALSENYADAYYYRGNALVALKRKYEALESFDRATAIKRDFVDALFARGMILEELKYFEEALKSYQSVASLRPEHAEAHFRRGRIFEEQKEFEKALVNYDSAIASPADHLEARNNSGVVLLNLGRLEEALACFDGAIAVKDNYALAHRNKGIILRDLNRLDEALLSIEKALQLNPDYADAYFDKSLVRLAQGNLGDGWKLYEWRWRSVKKDAVRKFASPLWLGEQPIRGKKLLIDSEQGLGDAIQTFRYLSVAEEAGAEIVLEALPPLVKLFKSSRKDIAIVEKGRMLPEVDFHCPLFSLPLAFQTTLDSIPSDIPYLFADESIRESWRARLGTKLIPRVGLCWSGNASFTNDKHRSIPFEILKEILELPIEFHSLQNEVRADDLKNLIASGKILQHQTELTDMAETAALAMEMDLVISVDTSIAHLAGALGVPVWVLLPFRADFRWLSERADSPWYPTATLFRQANRGDWRSVVGEVCTGLEDRFCGADRSPHSKRKRRVGMSIS